ncbi:hypothetical protein K2173_014638 [Erythroxylum novogranatense]|uniref:glucan endo-1,3-beta-D-glucosidase n=1 Tax=Erythroxylum novogranatense TaxID=1862640 RepID=A0AAV8TFC2_9ROSI|nr:hypothetical protein K2173_014638 [Erythroxylum novogranatense]
MGLFFILFLLCFLGLTGAGQESFQVLNIHDTTQGAHYVHSLVVFVRDGDINRVSNNVLDAESWLKSHVLAYFPTTKITTIVVDEAIQCQNIHGTRFHLILPSLKNLHYSLTRWGLETEIKVSTAISSNCFDEDLAIWKDDLAEKFTKPLLEFLHRTNSTYTVKLPPHFSTLSDETATLVSSCTEFVKKVGSLSLNKVNVIVTDPGQVKHVNRKLLSIDGKTLEPFPARPSPLPEISHSPLHTSKGFSVPANVAKKPHPPLSHVTSQPPLTVPHLTYPPPTSFPINSPPPVDYPVAPEQPPFLVPATAPFGYSSPPCNPTGNMAPSPQIGFVQKLWCVAKPSVPAETLQEAMDYACGEGGANCEEIKPNGSCFYPDTVVAHASYAFNSYWQNTKKNDGTCSFGGTAMLINADPSFLHCRFVLY